MLFINKRFISRIISRLHKIDSQSILFTRILNTICQCLAVAKTCLPAGAIASNFDSARPTISKHIQILNECELIESYQEGREIHYQIKIEKMKEIDTWLEQFRKIWENRFGQLDY